jgi:hypothetical protein
MRQDAVLTTEYDGCGMCLVRVVRLSRNPLLVRRSTIAAIVDRLTFNGTIIETGTDSYRLAGTRARAEEPPMVG